MKMALQPSFLTLPIAHRGLHSREIACPENSLFAAERAIEAGYAIELDLQLSRDGHPIVFHDYKLDRMTPKKGYVRNCNAAELQDLQLNESDEHIPTLDCLLKLVNGRVPLLIELKDQSQRYCPTNGALENATAEALKTYKGAVAVMSYSPHCIAYMSQYAPLVSRGLTTGGIGEGENDFSISDPLRQYDVLGASFISHNVFDLTSNIICEFKAKGDPLLCWTVQSEKQEKSARAIADNVTFECYLPKFP